MCNVYTCYSNKYFGWGVVVWLSLLVVHTCWKRVPRAFRTQRPKPLRIAMGLLALGTCASLLPSCGSPTIEDAETVLTVGLRCAEALGLLMVFEVIAYLRRPSSIPRARVTHGA